MKTFIQALWWVPVTFTIAVVAIFVTRWDSEIRVRDLSPLLRGWILFDHNTMWNWSPPDLSKKALAKIGVTSEEWFIYAGRQTEHAGIGAPCQYKIWILQKKGEFKPVRIMVLQPKFPIISQSTDPELSWIEAQKIELHYWGIWVDPDAANFYSLPGDEYCDAQKVTAKFVP